MQTNQSLKEKTVVLIADLNRFVGRAWLAKGGASYYTSRSSQDDKDLMKEVAQQFVNDFHTRMDSLHREIKDMAEATKDNRLIQLSNSLPGTWDSSGGTEAVIGWINEHAKWFAYASFWL